MSRIGKKTVAVPESVEVKIEKRKITVKGPKGTLVFEFHPDMKVVLEEKELRVENTKKTKAAGALWGLTRVLMSNMIEGVTKGYEKQLELQGVGYRMAVKGNKLEMALGFSHPVEVNIPEGLEAKIEKNVMTISGIDKQKVGQFTASIRSLKKVEPYKGKGFRYVGEIVRKKAGKKATTGDK
jgi:large subunit ribosomal protein L6